MLFVPSLVEFIVDPLITSLSWSIIHDEWISQAAWLSFVFYLVVPAGCVQGAASVMVHKYNGDSRIIEWVVFTTNWSILYHSPAPLARDQTSKAFDASTPGTVLSRNKQTEGERMVG